MLWPWYVWEIKTMAKEKEKKANWIAMGESANKAEERVFRYLEEQLPEDYTIYSNASITDDSGHTYECDAIVLARHAVYVIEIKDWSGIISGNARQWQLEDRATRPNPLPLIEQKARVLKANIKIKRVWVQPCVCFGGKRPPELRISDDQRRLQKLHWYQDIIPFLTDKTALTAPLSLKSKDLEAIVPNHHDDIKALIDPPFPRPYKIGPYFVQEEAWPSDQYSAHYAKLPGSRSHAYLLKTYQIPKETSAQEKKQLQRELSALNRIDSKGDPATGGREHVVIAVNEPIWQTKTKYIVPIEWVDGQLLISLLEETNLSLSARYRVAAQICRGLAYAHSAQVIHRNLSPANIIQTSEGIVKIINFDFAKFVAADVSMDTMDEVTLEQKYLAPELLGDGAHHKANRLTDIYAAGLIIWEMLVGFGAVRNRIGLSAIDRGRVDKCSGSRSGSCGIDGDITALPRT